MKPNILGLEGQGFLMRLLHDLRPKPNCRAFRAADPTMSGFRAMLSTYKVKVQTTPVPPETLNPETQKPV